jgi:hypothetical protein
MVYFKYHEREMIQQTWRVEAYVEWAFSFVMAIMVTCLCFSRVGDWSVINRIANQKGLSFPLLVVDWHLHILSHAFGGVLAIHPTYRLRFQAFLSARSETIAAAAGISALIGHYDTKQILSMSQRNFRKVTLTSLTKMDILNSKPDPTLFNKSEDALLGTVDVFLSHSWHDNAQAKWAALQEWRASFISKNSREPVIWFDKACINQRNIEENLACLPCFLAGSVLCCAEIVWEI